MTNTLARRTAAWSPDVDTASRHSDSMSYVLTDSSERRWPDEPLDLQVQSSTQLASFSRALDRLREIMALEPGWDSYGAQPVRFSAVDAALHILCVIAAQGVQAPHVVPMSNGGLQFEWHESAADLEIEIQDAEHVTVFLAKSDGQSWEGPLAEHRWGLQRFLAYVSNP